MPTTVHDWVTRRQPPNQLKHFPKAIASGTQLGIRSMGRPQKLVLISKNRQGVAQHYSSFQALADFGETLRHVRPISCRT